MMKKPIFVGCGTALITPFDDNGEINYFELKRLIEFQIASGVDALIILGTTGESATIGADERKDIIKFCVNQVSCRIPVIVGTGSNSTKTAIDFTRQAENLGADAVLVVSPYYNKASQDGLVLHYQKIAQCTKLPIIIYNVPSRTGVNVLPETVKKLSKIKNIVGIKEASGNMQQIQKLLQILPKDFYVYSGDDNLTLPLMSLGAKGVISVTSNIEPEKVSLLVHYALKGDFCNAKRIYDMLFCLSEALFFDVNPICIKWYMNLCGFNVGPLRLPLCEPSEMVKQALKNIKEKYEN